MRLIKAEESEKIPSLILFSFKSNYKEVSCMSCANDEEN